MADDTIFFKRCRFWNLLDSSFTYPDLDLNVKTSKITSPGGLRDAILL